MAAHMLHQRRTPGRHGDGVDQGQAGIVAAIKQMRAQGRGAAKIMGEHMGAFQAPMV